MTKLAAHVMAAVATPFSDEDNVDSPALIEHCRWLLGSGCDAVVLFGTTGEAASLTAEERRMTLERLVGAGVEPSRILVGTGCCAARDTAELTRHASEIGVAGCLILPPYFFKGVHNDGLRRYFDTVVKSVKAGVVRIFLYHIPQLAGVGVDPTLTGALLADHGPAIVGYKDSSGDWNNTSAILSMFPQLSIYVGSESKLLANLRAGGSGCISATANVNPRALGRLAGAWQLPEADLLQAQVTDTRKLVEQFPLIPAVKCLLSAIHARAGWATTRVPLQRLTVQQSRRLLSLTTDLIGARHIPLN